MAKEEIINLDGMDLTIENAERVDALIDLLIEKKIISEREYENKLEQNSHLEQEE